VSNKCYGVTKQGMKPEPIRPLVLNRTHYILSLSHRCYGALIHAIQSS